MGDKREKTFKKTEIEMRKNIKKTEIEMRKNIKETEIVMSNILTRWGLFLFYVNSTY